MRCSSNGQYLPKNLFKNRKLPTNISSELVKNAMPTLLGYLQPIEVNHSEVALLDLVFRENGYTSIEKIYAEISPACTDILLKCKWEQRLIPCENLFQRSNTKDGSCCSFNTRGNLIHSKEYRTLYYGLQMGLSLMIDPITSNITKAVSTLSSAGIKILIHSPEDHPGTSSIAKVLGNGTESFIRVLGSKLVSSDDIKSLTVEQRNCLFENDKGLKYFNHYRSSNCETECIMNNMYYYCKCITYIFQQTDKPVCNISNIRCLTENYNFIYRSTKATDISGRSPMPCDCPPQCNDVLYAVQTSSIPLRSITYTTSNFYKMDSSKDIFGQMVIHIYFGSYYQTVMLRDTITSAYYLLSSFGGVFSLFLGCSFISILEVMYYLYFCVRILTREQNSGATNTHIK